MGLDQMDVGLNRFQVRLAKNDADIAAAQRLRYEVFVEEMGATATQADHAHRLESDDYDPHFEHLLLIDRMPPHGDERVVGVYRLMKTEIAAQDPGFYGATEYDLGPLIASGRTLVELGRSCVLPSYRGGSAVYQLWNGLATYVLENKVEILFGTASFPGTDLERLAPALRYLSRNHGAPADLRAKAIGKGAADMDPHPEMPVSRSEAMLLIPALIKGYLRVGGVVGEGAYVDHDFNTVDILLMMDTTRMTARYREHYITNHAAGIT